MTEVLPDEVLEVLRGLNGTRSVQILSETDLEALTGHTQAAAQVRALEGIGIRPLRRRDGGVSVTWEAVHRAMAAANETKREEPNWDAISG